MGCIVATGRRVGQSLRAYAERVGDSLEVSAMRVGSNLRMTAGLVCSTSSIDAFLKVSPDTVWLTPSNSFSADFVVVSNVSWRVE